MRRLRTPYTVVWKGLTSAESVPIPLLGVSKVNALKELMVGEVSMYSRCASLSRSTNSEGLNSTWELSFWRRG